MTKKRRVRLATLALAAFVMWAGLEAGTNPALAKGSKQLTGVVNINTATAEELMLLPGIGKAKADAIISYRTATPFNSVDELEKVKGIGKETLERLRPYISVSGETTASVSSEGAPLSDTQGS